MKFSIRDIFSKLKAYQERMELFNWIFNNKIPSTIPLSISASKMKQHNVNSKAMKVHKQINLDYLVDNNFIDFENPKLPIFTQYEPV